MITNFNNEVLPLVDLLPVQAGAEGEEPTTFFRLIFQEGELEGKILLVGKLSFVEESNGISFHAEFPEESDEDNENLIGENMDLINAIVVSIVQTAADAIQEEADEGIVAIND